MCPKPIRMSRACGIRSTSARCASPATPTGLHGRERRCRPAVPIWVKPYLTIEEAAEYTGIGRDKLYEMTSLADCPFVLWVGNRRMIKRRIFDEYIEQMYSI